MRLEEAFAIVLKKHRKKKGFSQHNLAYEANMSHNNITLYETADRLPSFTTFFKLCQALEVSPDEFIREVALLKPIL